MKRSLIGGLVGMFLVAGAVNIQASHSRYLNVHCQGNVNGFNYSVSSHDAGKNDWDRCTVEPGGINLVIEHLLLSSSAGNSFGVYEGSNRNCATSSTNSSSSDLPTNGYVATNGTLTVSLSGGKQYTIENVAFFNSPMNWWVGCYAFTGGNYGRKLSYTAPDGTCLYLWFCDSSTLVISTNQ